MENHKHIPFHGGHITWHGEKPPNKKVMEAFEAMRDAVEKMSEKYYYLKKGETIQEGDECGTMQKYNDDDYTWTTETRCVGEPAPDPKYMAHRKYRRLITNPNTSERVKSEK